MSRILLVDDNVSLLSVLGQALREHGHKVTSTNSGADALCLLGALVPDLLILDINMPGLDGYQVIRSLPPLAPPVVVISGGVIDPARLDATRVNRVLQKPFDLPRLLEVVESVVGPQPDAKGAPK